MNARIEVLNDNALVINISTKTASVTVLCGIDQDGGGFIVMPSGRFVKIPPEGPGDTGEAAELFVAVRTLRKTINTLGNNFLMCPILSERMGALAQEIANADRYPGLNVDQATRELASLEKLYAEECEQKGSAKKIK